MFGLGNANLRGPGDVVTSARVISVHVSPQGKLYGAAFSTSMIPYLKCGLDSLFFGEFLQHRWDLLRSKGTESRSVR